MKDLKYYHSNYLCIFLLVSYSSIRLNKAYKIYFLSISCMRVLQVEVEQCNNSIEDEEVESRRKRKIYNAMNTINYFQVTYFKTHIFFLCLISNVFSTIQKSIFCIKGKIEWKYRLCFFTNIFRIKTYATLFQHSKLQEMEKSPVERPFLPDPQGVL